MRYDYERIGHFDDKSDTVELNVIRMVGDNRIATVWVISM